MSLHYLNRPLLHRIEYWARIRSHFAGLVTLTAGVRYMSYWKHTTTQIHGIELMMVIYWGRMRCKKQQAGLANTYSPLLIDRRIHRSNDGRGYNGMEEWQSGLLGWAWLPFSTALLYPGSPSLLCLCHSPVSKLIILFIQHQELCDPLFLTLLSTYSLLLLNHSYPSYTHSTYLITYGFLVKMPVRPRKVLRIDGWRFDGGLARVFEGY